MKRNIVRASGNIPDSSFDFSRYQTDAMVTIIEKLQDYVTLTDIPWQDINKRVIADMIPLNKNFDFEAKFHISDVSPAHVKRVYEDIRGLMKKKYFYVTESNGVNTYMEGILVHNCGIDDKGIITLCISVAALRWLLEWIPIHGKEQLFLFDSIHCKSLYSVYSKRIYLILSKHYQDRYFTKTISELIKELHAPKYSPYNFEQKVLGTSFLEMLGNPTSKLFFKWRFKKSKSRATVGRKTFEEVEFKVYNCDKEESMEEFLTDNWSDRKIITQAIEELKAM